MILIKNKNYQIKVQTRNKYIYKMVFIISYLVSLNINA